MGVVYVLEVMLMIGCGDIMWHSSWLILQILNTDRLLHTVKQESFEEAGNFRVFTILDDFVAGNFSSF